jgi:hypothetical protein
MWEEYWLLGRYRDVPWRPRPQPIYDPAVDWRRWRGQRVLLLDAGTFLHWAPMFTTLGRFAELTEFEAADFRPVTVTRYKSIGGGTCTPVDIVRYGGPAPSTWIQVTERVETQEWVLVRRPWSRILEHRVYPAKPRPVKPIQVDIIKPSE